MRQKVNGCTDASRCCLFTAKLVFIFFYMLHHDMNSVFKYNGEKKEMLRALKQVIEKANRMY